MFNYLFLILSTQETYLTIYLNLTYLIFLYSLETNIRWIRTGFHPYEKTMSSIVFYPVFNVKMYNQMIKTSFFRHLYFTSLFTHLFIEPLVL